MKAYVGLKHLRKRHRNLTLLLSKRVCFAPRITVSLNNRSHDRAMTEVNPNDPGQVVNSAMFGDKERGIIPVHHIPGSSPRLLSIDSQDRTLHRATVKMAESKSSLAWRGSWAHDAPLHPFLCT